MGRRDWSNDCESRWEHPTLALVRGVQPRWSVDSHRKPQNQRPDYGRPTRADRSANPRTRGAGVTSVAFSSDGQTILTASLDQTVQLWDAATGQRMGRASATSRHRRLFGAAFVSPTAGRFSSALTRDGRGYGGIEDGQPLGQPIDYGSEC